MPVGVLQDGVPPLERRQGRERLGAGTLVADVVGGSVARHWGGYADPGGDLAYAAEVGDHSVLVYGSAPGDDLRAIVESLTTARLAR